MLDGKCVLKPETGKIQLFVGLHDAKLAAESRDEEFAKNPPPPDEMVECDWCDDHDLHPKRAMHRWGTAQALICEDCFRKTRDLYPGGVGAP